MFKPRLSIIWSHRPYSPYVMTLATEATVFGFKKVFPLSRISTGVNYWQNRQNTYLYPQKQYSQTADSLARQTITKPGFLIKSLKIAYYKAVRVNKYSKQFTAKKIKAANNQTLVKWVETFSRRFKEMYAYGTVAILIGYSQDNQLYTSAEKILKQRTTRGSGAFANFYVTLTSPPQLNRASSLDREIIKLAKRARQENYSTLSLIKKHYRREIKKIIADYKWLSFDLCDNVSWDELYIAKLVAEKKGQDLDKQLQDLTRYSQRTQQAFKETVRELGLSPKEIDIFECLRYLGYYKWAREYEFTEALFSLKAVQDELGRRLKIGSLAMKYLLPDEYPQLLNKAGYYRKELPLRVKRCLVINDSKKKTKVMTGQPALKIWNQLRPRNKSGSRVTIVKGSPTYSGLVKGTVRIVNSTKQMSKILTGDILIAVTTNPTLLPAMKKAAAIVTDEGGITSHAAIVARELQIPCIVGAKGATKIFKDGQLVEVDAKHGIVRVIK